MNRYMSVIILILALPISGFTSPIDTVKEKYPLVYEELSHVPRFRKDSAASKAIAGLLINSGNPDVERAFHIMAEGHNVHRKLEGEFGDYVKQKKTGYNLPAYNTAFFLLYELASLGPLESLVAPSIAISNSFLITFGSPGVRKAAVTTCMEFYKFLLQIDEIQKSSNIFHLSDYPLEALIQMCRIWGTGMAGPSCENESVAQQDFASFLTTPITLKRFEWNTINLTYLSRLKNYFSGIDGYTLSSTDAVEKITQFIWNSNHWKYPAVASLNPDTGVPYECIDYDGISVYNSNMHNPDYIPDMLFQDKDFFGWCTDVRQSMQFVATALGIATLHTGYGIIVDKKEYSHYYVIFYRPELKTWARHKGDYTATPDDRRTPVIFLNPVLDQWDYWKEGDNWHQGNFFTYNDAIEASKIAELYDIGIPTGIVKAVTFDKMKIDTSLFTTLCKDADKDLASDFMEKNIFATNPVLPDSDKDTYSDYWEILHGYNPLDKASPADKNIIALDGILNDFLNRKEVKILQDTKGDNKGTGTPDIKALYIKPGKTAIYFGISYFTKPLTNNIYTFHIQTGTNKNYWVQWGDNWGINILKFENGTPFEEWEKAGILAGVSCTINTNPELALPYAQCENPDSLSIRFIAGDNTVWDADSTEFITVSPINP
ncbi:MAG: hypothetical protein JXJ04_06185 [Spirochaetales bacterium]|nr:hypothetical protein [Spirochaetales bacterium]